MKNLKNLKNRLLFKDSYKGLKSINDNSINMIFTSPPYAEQRKNTYGGLNPTNYNEWFIKYVKEMERVLKNDGSFFLNIKEHSKDGFRDTYVLKLVLKILEETNFKLIDTIRWTKNAYPGKYKNKFKNGWEPVYHFALNSDIQFFPNEVAEPIKNPEWYKKKSKKKITKNGSGFVRPRMEDISKLKYAKPSNVLNINNVVNQYSINKWHPAVFPIKLVEFFIKSYSKQGDIILDPFMGSGTTAKASINLKRFYIGFENCKEYYLKSYNDIKNYK